MTLRPTEIDETNRADHSYLTPDDRCIFFYEYHSNLGWKGGLGNQLIHNLQKKAGQGGYQYKAVAIADCAKLLSRSLDATWCSAAAFVPVPPSKAKTDPLYDDRMLKVCNSIRNPNRMNVRELIEQTQSAENFKSGNRLRPDELKAMYSLNNKFLADLPNDIVIVDDVLTTGCHFRAMKDVILSAKPTAAVLGIFIARRALPNPFENIMDI